MYMNAIEEKTLHSAQLLFPTLFRFISFVPTSRVVRQWLSVVTSHHHSPIGIFVRAQLTGWLGRIGLV